MPEIELRGGPMDGERVLLDLPPGAPFRIPLPQPLDVVEPSIEELLKPTFREAIYRVRSGGFAEWEGEGGPELPTDPPPQPGAPYKPRPLDFGPDLWDLLEPWRF